MAHPVTEKDAVEGPWEPLAARCAATVSFSQPLQKSDSGSLWRPLGPRWRLPWPAQTPKADFYHPSYAFWPTQGGGGCRWGPVRAVGGFGTAAVSPPNLSQKSEFDSLWRPSGPRWRLPWPAQTPEIDFYYPSHAFWPTPGGRWTAVVSPRTPLTPLRNLNSEVSGDHLGLAGGCLG